MIRIFRKRPVIVEARQIDAQDWDEVQEIAAWCGGDLVNIEEFLAAEDYAVMAITTLEGILYAEDGDWVIHGTHGEFYPCKPNVFAAIYEPVVDL